MSICPPPSGRSNTFKVDDVEEAALNFQNNFKKSLLDKEKVGNQNWQYGNNLHFNQRNSRSSFSLALASEMTAYDGEGYYNGQLDGEALEPGARAAIPSPGRRAAVLPCNQRATDSGCVPKAAPTGTGIALDVRNDVPSIQCFYRKCAVRDAESAKARVAGCQNERAPGATQKTLDALIDRCACCKCQDEGACAASEVKAKKFARRASGATQKTLGRKCFCTHLCSCST
ncbi:hypothetical protein C8R46DRAFT_1033783 [Mycena filopes]|nr:hypothetical protein C8R46DRAFT_1033783 [Mycena filopes]